MQTSIVKKIPSLKVGYIDPWWISSNNFNDAKTWKLDGEELKNGKTVEEKEAIRNDALHKAGVKVAARIARFLRNLQHNRVVWLPYHFG